MYPPVGRWIFKQDITQFQPIAISSTIPNTDPMINPHCNCKNAWAEKDQIMKSEYARKIQMDNQELYYFLSKHAGIEIKNIEDAKAIYDSLVVEVSNIVHLIILLNQIFYT